MKKVIDMTQSLYHNCPGWYAYEMAEIKHETVVGVDGYTSEQIKLNTHTATHLDAPAHFYPDMKTIDEMPLDLFMGKAVLVNLDGVPANYEIKVKDLEPYADLIKKDSIVLLNTGWSKKRNYGEDYYKNWPYLSGEGAKWLHDKGIKGVGIDGMSLGGSTNGRPAHVALLPYEVWILEEVYFPDEILKYKEFEFTAVPLKLVGCGGSPARAYAVVE